jgi:hypothetical protein
LECKQGPLSPEEDALEFTLLDLSACISPDALPPPIPLASGSGAAASGSVALIYQSATFTEDFTSSCPQGTRAVWRTLDWQASIPDTASIDFSAQTDVIPADGGSPQYSAMPVLLGTATATTACTCGFCPGPSGGDAGTDAGVDAGSDAGSTCTPPAYIDTGTTGAFNMANPPIISRDALRLTVTLYPTSDGRAAPTLMGWQVKADCLPSE